jgi:Mrp family chromosome partitioning ATPase
VADPTNRPPGKLVAPDEYTEERTTPGVTFKTTLPPRSIAAPLGEKRNVIRRETAPLPGMQLPPAPSAPVPAVTARSIAAEPVELIKVHQIPVGETGDPRLVLVRTPDSAAAASFRVLRHRLAARAGLRVILVTSPTRREGKTTLAVNLALALGEAGRARVLLLEANLRHPSVARLLGFRPPVCFGEQLEFHRTHPQQPWVVVETLSPSFHVAAVSPDAQTRPLVDGPAVAIALAQLRGAPYDFIVLDSPPILGSADTNLIEEHVDGVVLALGARRSHARALRRAVDQIGRDKIIGTVLLGG